MRKRKLFAWVLLAALVLGLAACTQKPEETIPSAGRMVQRIEIAFHPEDEVFSRVYVTQENMNAMLKILRGFAMEEPAADVPELDSGVSYYTATISRANGEQSVYRLMSHTFVQVDGGDWYVAESGQAMTFVNFLQEHPSDDGSAPAETTLPPETTLPVETTAATE